MTASHPMSPAGAAAYNASSPGNNNSNNEETPDDEPSYVTDQDVVEEIVPDDDEPMDDADEDDQEDPSSTSYRGAGTGEQTELEVELVNDSQRYFDTHTDSIFAISIHPTLKDIVATGGGDDVAYIWSSAPEVSTTGSTERESQKVRFKVTRHTDSVSCITFTKSGEYLITAGLDGRISITRGTRDGKRWKTISTVQEVEEINWVKPHPINGNVFAVGANDGSVWIYTIDPDAKGAELTITHVFYNQTASCTAGCFSADGKLILTVAEDSTFVVHDTESGEVKVALDGSDARFNVQGGLYAVAVNPLGTIAAVGGATGEVKIVALSGTRGTQSGQLLATLATQAESIESLTFSPTLPLLVSASVDGSIVLYETARWSTRRTIRGHEDAVVKVEFGSGQGGWELTSCSVDGTVRRWDCRSGESIGVWRGHSDGVLDFVVGADGRIVSAGDDGVALVFEAGAATTTVASSTGGP